MSIYNKPAEYDFIPHYKGDGLNSFALRIKLDNVLLDLEDAKVAMQLRHQKTNVVHYEFNSESEGQAKITIQNPGVIQFPEIKSWDIEANTYEYDLQITDKDGFVTTFLRGIWKVNQDITEVK